MEIIRGRKLTFVIFIVLLTDHRSFYSQIILGGEKPLYNGILIMNVLTVCD